MTMTDNTRQPLVSFIVTCYNLPVNMLCECIDSILRLTLRPFEREIIVVDDGSDTSPMNDLLKYGDDIIYVRQKNHGVSVARNTAMDMAKGQYIQIIDGDDYLIKAPYEHCLDIVRYNSDPDVVMFDFTHQAAQTINAINTPVKKNGAELMRTKNIQRTTLLHPRHCIRRRRGIHTPTADPRRNGLYHRGKGLFLSRAYHISHTPERRGKHPKAPR